MPYNEDWGKKLRFTEEDLAYNRRGQTSPNQMKAVRLNKWGMWFMTIFFGGSCAVLGIAVISRSLVFALIMFGLGIGLVYIGNRIIRAYIQALENNKVVKVVTPIVFTERRLKNVKMRFLQTPNGLVTLKGSLWDYPPKDWYQDKLFHVYYLDGAGHHFLSLEETDADKTSQEGWIDET